MPSPGRSSIVVGLALAGLVIAEAQADEPALSATADLRPTVQLRNGERRGSGTVIASVPGETLILTAAHVVKDAQDLEVEIHRYNLGRGALELTEGGGWPRLVKATVVASRPSADVAVARIRGMTALPYVARFEVTRPDPSGGEVVSSVGIDRTRHLARWRTVVKGVANVDIGQGGGASRFLVTDRPPEHGRSGGGLFLADGTLVGVCTGRVNAAPGRPTLGLFASLASVRELLDEHDLVRAVSRSPRER